jgi:Protein of unknown function (DUF998)
MSQKNRALAGVVAPVMFGAVILVLTIAQYDFLTGLGWRPVGDTSGVPWPSGLALGPFGWLHVANSVVFGALLVAFAPGLHRGMAGGSRVGPALLAVAGAAFVLSGFKTDPDISGGPQSWHGLIHGIAYLLIVFSLLPSFFFLWWGMRRDPPWRAHGLYTLVTGVAMVVLFLTPWSLSFYFFLALMLVWVEVTAWRLRSLTADVAAERGTEGGTPWQTRATP